MRTIQRKRWSIFGILLIVITFVNEYAYGIVLQIAANYGGWPYSPSILGEVSWIYETTGILGLTSRILYLTRGFFYLIGFLALLYRELSIRYD